VRPVDQPDFRYGLGMSSSLEIYLQNHEAAAQAGSDLFRRTAANQRSRAYGEELPKLAAQIKEDHRRLRSILTRVGARPNVPFGLALRLGERIGRLKPNGRLFRRSPLSDLIEIEGLLDAVAAKRTGWQALATVDPAHGIDPDEIDELITRADDQLQQLRALHSRAANQALNEH
jgi:hypothetical protein